MNINLSKSKRILDIVTIAILTVGGCINSLFVLGVIKDKSWISLGTMLVCLGNCIVLIDKKRGGKVDTILQSTTVVKVTTVIAAIFWFVSYLFAIGK